MDSLVVMTIKHFMFQTRLQNYDIVTWFDNYGRTAVNWAFSVQNYQTYSISNETSRNSPTALFYRSVGPCLVVIPQSYLA